MSHHVPAQMVGRPWQARLAWWVLMLFSALIGAGLMVNALVLGVPARPLLFLALFAVGLVGQWRLVRPAPSNVLDADG